MSNIEGTLVTQRMLQCQPNHTSYIQILSSFQKYEQNVPALLLLSKM